MLEDSDKRHLQVLHLLICHVRICIALEHINKVLPLASLEPVPGGPEYLVGLLNLAGKSIPIIDLATYLGLPRDDNYTVDTPILICNYDDQKFGMIIDHVKGISTVEDETLQMCDEFKKDNSPFLAVVTIDSELSLLINIPKILSINLLSANDYVASDDKLLHMATIKNE